MSYHPNNPARAGGVEGGEGGGRGGCAPGGAAGHGARRCRAAGEPPGGGRGAGGDARGGGRRGAPPTRGGAEERARTAAQRYREAVLAREPDLPAELVSGASVEEIDESVTRARQTVAQVRQRLEQQAPGQRH